MIEASLLKQYLFLSHSYFELLAKQTTGNYLVERFPTGCCGNVSHIPGCFLYTNVRYTAGERTVNGQYQTHAWLGWDGWIIDITADQFSDGPSAVFLERDSDFHRSFARDYECEPAISSCIAAQNQKFLSTIKV